MVGFVQDMGRRVSVVQAIAGNCVSSFAQWRSAHQNFKSRQIVLRTDTWLEDSLCFVPSDVN